MPAQPLDNTKNQQSSVGTDPISTNFASGVSTATADPYSTLRAENVTSSEPPITMTESKRLEIVQNQTGSNQATQNNSNNVNNTSSGQKFEEQKNTPQSLVNGVETGTPAVSIPQNTSSDNTVDSVASTKATDTSDVTQPSTNSISPPLAENNSPSMQIPESTTPIVTDQQSSNNISVSPPPSSTSTSPVDTTSSQSPDQSNIGVDIISIDENLPEGVKLIDESTSENASSSEATTPSPSSTIPLSDEVSLPMDLQQEVGSTKLDESAQDDIPQTTQNEDPDDTQPGLVTDTQETIDPLSPEDTHSSNESNKSSEEFSTEPAGDVQEETPVVPTITDSAKTLADILVDMEVLDRKTADEVKLAEVKSGNSQEIILTDQNLADSAQISKAKAKLYNVEYVDISKTPVNPEALNLLPQQVAEKFNVFPVSVDVSSNKLVVAMADPLNLTAIEFIEQRTGKTVVPKAADPHEIENIITAGYTTSLAKEVSEALKDVSEERRKVRTLDAGRTGLIREEKVAEVVSHILGFAIKSRASDVHIEPQEQATRVRYRIDGILQEKLTTPRELHDALVSRIKILSGMKIDEKRVPQDGRFNFRSDAEEVDLRVSTLPTAWGEKIVMRLLKKTGGIPELPELGLRGRALTNLQEAILRPHGIILITGPTGSGKTTTLYSIIQKLNTPKVNIMTLEDPVEYKIHGVNQVQANPVAGLTFASGLRSFLRQDPNIILVGEIRDQETADLAIQASLTGHLVFSTLHTNSAAGALPRLLDMGAEPYLLASSISAIVGQRVVRKIHQDCKSAYVPDPKIIEQMQGVLGNLWKPKPGEIKLYKGQGDKDCNNSGYLGRVGVFEVLPVSEKIGRLILEQAPSGDIDKQAREEGMVSMQQDGYLKVMEGITTIEEVLRVAHE